MKKFLAGLILGLMLATSGVALAASAIRVYVDGKEVISDVPAQIIDGRTVLPVRAISEAMGASVSWDEVSNSVYITSKVYTPEPVVAPDIPVGVDVSPPVTPADTSVTSAIYETPPTQETISADQMYLSVRDGKAVFATHLVRCDIKPSVDRSVLLDPFQIEPEGLVIYNEDPIRTLAIAERNLKELGIPYIVEVLDYEAYKLKAQGIIYQSRTEAINHLLYDKIPHSLK